MDDSFLEKKRIYSRFFQNKLQNRNLSNYHRAQTALTILVCSALTSY